VNLETAILEVLSASPRAIPTAIISAYLPTTSGRRETHADIDAALRRLEGKQQVVGTCHEDKGTLWKETADGRLRLAS
jgi:hypothetical protein